MAATKQLLHHRYRDDIAYDWSGNANHGYLVHVQTGDGSASPNRLLFGGVGESRVEVRPSDSLRDFGELRIRVVFRPDQHGSMHRYNLVEGEYSFALVRDDDGALHGTIRSPSAGWIGPRSAPGIVTLGQWHVADFIHDGVSHARLYLDGQLVGERFDAAGPIGNLGSRGVWIAHWPGDDRYTFIGQLDEVEIWKDDPKRDADRVVDECCLDRSWVDARIDEARRRGWTGAQARDSFVKLFGDARAAAAEVRAGDPGRTNQINALTQQALNAMAVRDAGGLEGTLGTLQGLIVGQLGMARVEQLGHEMLDALRSSPVGDWMGSTDDEALSFFEEIADKACLRGIVPERPSRGDDEHPHPPEKLPDGAPLGEPVTDRPPPTDPVPANEHVDVPPGVDPDDPTAGGATERNPSNPGDPNGGTP